MGLFTERDDDYSEFESEKTALNSKALSLYHTIESLIRRRGSDCLLECRFFKKGNCVLFGELFDKLRHEDCVYLFGE